ncbi:four helix bundle protein [Candidatus Parcubacteria bacterium]|nr:MAG: four helix bundle protein [Candidatus Parcubacteria bacterium]
MNNEKIKSFTDLNSWKKSHELVLAIYTTTKNFPKEELFGLTPQIKRSAISITSNIAEGFSRPSYKDKIKFYYIAQGSLTELQNQLLIAKDVKYITNQSFEELANKTITSHKLISGLIKKSKEIHDS